MREGTTYERDLPDGRNLTVYPLTFGQGRLLLSDNAETQAARDVW